MENSSAASASSEAGSSRSQEIEELERFIDSYVLEYQVQGLLADKTEGDGESEQTQSHISQVSTGPGGRWGEKPSLGRYRALVNFKQVIRGPKFQIEPGCLALDCHSADGPTQQSMGSRQEAPGCVLSAPPLPSPPLGSWGLTRLRSHVTHLLSTYCVLSTVPCPLGLCSRRGLEIVACPEDIYSQKAVPYGSNTGPCWQPKSCFSQATHPGVCVPDLVRCMSVLTRSQVALTPSCVSMWQPGLGWEVDSSGRLDRDVGVSSSPD